VSARCRFPTAGCRFDLRRRVAPLTTPHTRKPLDSPELAETANLALVRDYLAALEAGEAGPPLARFFTANAVQVEFPNRLNPHGGRSDLATMLERSLQGKQLLQSQEYRVRSAIAHADRVAVEADWTGTLAIPAAGLPAGGVMRAHFAMFFECVEGKIHRQHNYDCFEPW
jgi:ketosteroid isomerase-like protein